MAAIEFLAGRGDNRFRQNLIISHALWKGNSIHMSLALLIERENGGPCRASEISAHNDLNGQNIEALANHHIRVRVGHDMVRTNVFCLLKPVASCFGQNLTLIWDAGQYPVESTQAVGGDDDPVAIRQIIVLADLATIVFRQFGDDGFRQYAHGISNLLYQMRTDDMAPETVDTLWHVSRRRTSTRHMVALSGKIATHPKYPCLISDLHKICIFLDWQC